MDSLVDASKAAVNNWLSKSGNDLPNLENHVKKTALPKIDLVNILRGSSLDVGASRLGGEPDLPLGLDWPLSQIQGSVQTFLCQINLSEILFKSDLPDSGWLIIFLDNDEPANNVGNTITYIPEGSVLNRRSYPSDSTSVLDESPFPVCQVGFEASFSIPTDNLPDIELPDSEVELLYDTQSEFHLLGWHEEWNGDPRRDAYFYANGMEDLQYGYYLKPGDEKYKNASPEKQALIDQWHANKDEHLSEIEKWKVLLKLGSSTETGFCWWDAGMLEFIIHEDDLKNQNFSNVYCNLATS